MIAAVMDSDVLDIDTLTVLESSRLDSFLLNRDILQIDK